MLMDSPIFVFLKILNHDSNLLKSAPSLGAYPLFFFLCVVYFFTQQKKYDNPERVLHLFERGFDTLTFLSLSIS